MSSLSITHSQGHISNLSNFQMKILSVLSELMKKWIAYFSARYMIYIGRMTRLCEDRWWSDNAGTMLSMNAHDRELFRLIKRRAVFCLHKWVIQSAWDLGLPLPSQASDRIFRKILLDLSVQVSQLQPERLASQAAGRGNHDHMATWPFRAVKENWKNKCYVKKVLKKMKLTSI